MDVEKRDVYALEVSVGNHDRVSHVDDHGSEASALALSMHLASFSPTTTELPRPVAVNSYVYTSALSPSILL
jgi:hypothetical protein